MKTTRGCYAGFTLVEVMVVVAIIGLLAGIALPNFLQARRLAQRSTCINNLRQIDTAVQQWALEQGKPAGAPVTYPDISSYLKHTVICPAGGTTFDDSYTITSVAAIPACQKVPLTHFLEVARSALASTPPDPGATTGSGGSSGHGNGKGGSQGKGNQGQGQGQGNGQEP